MKISFILQEGKIFEWQKYILEAVDSMNNINYDIILESLNNSHFTNNVFFNSIKKIESKFFNQNLSAFGISTLEKEWNIVNEIKESTDLIINLTGFKNKRFINMQQWHIETENTSIGLDPIIGAIAKGNGTIEIKIISEIKEKRSIVNQAFTCLETIPVYKIINKLYWKCAGLIINAIRGIENTDLKINNNSSISKINKTKHYFSHLTRLGSRFLHERKHRGQWEIYFSANMDQAFHFDTYNKIAVPNDRFWADPFYIQHEGKKYIFFEELVYKEKKGKISCIELFPNGKHSNTRVVLEKSYHLSYPFLFENEGSIYMVPESKDAKSIQLYKAKNFPFEWELKKILIDNIEAVDATIHFYNNKYWLFANVSQYKNYPINDDLYLYYTDNFLTGNWIPHPQNPIIQDCSSSRPAGRLFEENDKLYRPSQNGSFIYGRGIKINEIEVLSETNYKEKTIEELNPDWKQEITRNHTFNKYDDFVVIDAMKSIRK